MPPPRSTIHVVLLAVLAGACQTVQAHQPAVPRFSPAACSTVAVPGRTVTMHLPPGRLGPLPLLVALHGLGGTGHGLEVDSGLDAIADRDGAVIAYPDALRGQWNQAPAVMGSTPDDAGFLVQLVNRLVATGCADPQRVYAIGVSNGGGMAYRLACEAADRIAAVGLVSADYLGSDRCARSRPVAAIAFHGTADTRVPLGGVTYGTSVHPPVESWATGWAARNGCPAGHVHTVVTGARVLDWQGCPQLADVLLYEVSGGTHGWFKSPVDAGALSWGFFGGRVR